MKILLLSSVKKVGERGDVKEIKDGFAMNYLIPRGLATPYESVSAKRILASEKLNNSAKQKNEADITRIFGDINSKQFVITRKQNKQGRYYASIGVEDISKAIGIDKKYLGSIAEIKITEPKTIAIQLAYKDQRANIQLEAN